MKNPESKAALDAQRVFDIAVATVALTLLAPLMLLIMIAIIIESGRPVFFAHRRVGQRGQPFLVYKFRKFGRDCSPDGLQLTLDEDPRFTRVGRFLAKTKLDELPQFFNVLKGDMSIVGPRPESLHYADCFSGEFERVLTYKPGLVGPSQVKFRHESAEYPAGGDLDAFYRAELFPSKARIDLDYYPKRTLEQDVQWLFRAVVASLSSRKI